MDKQKLFQVILVMTFTALSYTELKSQDSTIQSINGCNNVFGITEHLLPVFNNIYGEETTYWLEYPHLKFSPDGKILAIEIVVSRSHGNNEVWMFDLKTKTARRVIERVPEEKGTVYIKGFKWLSSSVLDVFIEKYDKEHPYYNIISGSQVNINPEYEKYNGNFVVRATMDSSDVEKYQGTNEDSFISKDDWPIYSTSPSGKWRFISPHHMDTTSLIDLSNKRSYLCSTSYHDFKWTNDEKYVVFNDGGGSGGMDLKASVMKTPLKPFRIEHGSWELGGFCIAPKGHLIAYTSDNYESHRGEIVIYDLDKKNIIRQIHVGSSPDRVEWSSQNLFAVTCRSCTIYTEKGKVHYGYGVYIYDVSSFFK